MKRKIVTLILAASMACQPVLVSAEDFVSQDEFTAAQEQPIQTDEGLDETTVENQETEFQDELQDSAPIDNGFGDAETLTLTDDPSLELSDGEWGSEIQAPSVGDNGKTIPAGAKEWGGHYYQAYDLSMTWSKAKSYCESLGGHLVTITSVGEQNTVASAISYGSKNFYWIGMERDENFKFSSWITGESITYTNYDIENGEPNNFTGEENVLIMYRIANPLAGVDGQYKWNDLQANGECNGEEFFGTLNSGFVCEWDSKPEEEQIRYALKPEQVWGFTQEQLYQLSGGLSLSDYTKFFSSAQASLLLKDCNGSGGYCSGMATSVNAIAGHDCVPVSSFLRVGGAPADNLSDIINPNSMSVATFKKASDYVKYAHVYQFTSSVLKEKRKHSGDLNGLYQAVKNSISGNGDYVEIRMRGAYGDESDCGHCVLAMGISKETDQEVEILVYDGNYSSTLNKFYLYKENGQFTSWKYDQSATGFVNWGTGHINNKITYTFTGNNFKKDVTSKLDKLNIDIYKYLVSVTNKNTTIKTSGGSQALSGSVVGDIIPLEADSGTENSGSNMYWVDTDKEISIQSAAADNDIQIAANNRIVSADIPANASVSTNLNTEELKTDIENLSSGKDFSVTLTQYTESDTPTAATVTGTSSAGTVTVKKETGNIVAVNGTRQAEVQFLNADGTKTEKIKVDLKGMPSQVELTTEKTTVKQDTDGNGTYDKVVYDSSDNGKIEVPKLNKTSSTHNSIKVTWGSVAKAEKYQVYRKVNKGKWKAVKYVTGTSYTDKNVKAGNTYYYTVKACRTVDGKQVYSTYNTKGVSGKLTTSISLKTKSRKVTISWKKTKSAAGYYIYRASSAKGKYSKIKKVTSGKTLKYTDKKVKKGKTYYYKVVPYGKNGKKTVKCSASAVKKIKVK